jgi:hypothetical protein
MVRLLLLLTLSACSFGVAGDEQKSDDEGGGDDTAADTSGDTDTDTDTDTDPGADVSTYEAFSTAHAETYCASLESCGFLDEQGYADRAACEAAILDVLGRVPCETYQVAAATNCIQADAQIAANCEGSREGAQPLVCRDVCEATPSR